MAPEQIRALLTTVPFRPFRVFMASGQSYVCHGPEWMMIVGGTTALGIPGESEDGGRIHLLDNRSITNIEPADEIKK